MSAQADVVLGSMGMVSVPNGRPWGDGDVTQATMRRRVVVVAVVMLAHIALAALLLAPRWITVSTPLPPITVMLIDQPPPPVVSPPMPSIVALPTSTIVMPVPEIDMDRQSPLQSESTATEVSVSIEKASTTVNHVVSGEAAPVIVSESEVDYLHRPRVEYPVAAKRLKEQGIALLLVLIDESGCVLDTAVIQSTGSPRLDQSALRALKHARFRPYLQNGVAIPVQVRVPVEFSIKTAA